MRNYAVAAVNTAVVAADGAWVVYQPASALGRGSIYDLVQGCGDTPADHAAGFTLRRATTGGTSTSVTPSPLDPADSASSILAGNIVTTEPGTPGVSLLTFAMNQRMTFRWVAQPGSELVIPATNNAAIENYVTVTSAAFDLNYTVLFSE